MMELKEMYNEKIELDLKARHIEVLLELLTYMPENDYNDFEKREWFIREFIRIFQKTKLGQYNMALKSKNVIPFPKKAN